jgi:hypothetical protein
MPDLLNRYVVRDVWDSGRVHDICGYRAFVKAIRDETGVRYHTAVQDGGTLAVTFPSPKQCYGQSLQPETVTLPLSSRIDHPPVPLAPMRL